MSVVGFLTNEYSIILNETKKKQSALKTSLEAAISKLKAYSTEKQDLSHEIQFLAEPEALPVVFEPLFLSLGEKNTKVMSCTLSCVTRLISQNAFPTQLLTRLLDCLSSVTDCSADNSLKIIQIAMGIVLNYACVTGETLKTCFSICIGYIKNYTAKSKSTSIDVFNAASVTLRQLAMTVVVKLKFMNRPGDRCSSADLGCSAATIAIDERECETYITDVYRIFQDVCQHFLGEKNSVSGAQKFDFLALETLPESHSLEIVESMLNGNAKILRASSVLKQCLHESLFPSLIKKFTEKQNYVVYVRILRLIRIIFSDYFEDFPMISETFLSLLHKDMSDFEFEWQHTLCVELLKSVFAEHATAAITIVRISRNSSLESVDRAFVAVLENAADFFKGSAESDAVSTLTGNANRNRLKFIDQLEKSAPFTHSAAYDHQILFEMFCGLIQRLFFSVCKQCDVEADMLLNISPSISFIKYDCRPDAAEAVVPFINANWSLFYELLVSFFVRFPCDDVAVHAIHGLAFYCLILAGLWHMDDFFRSLFGLVFMNQSIFSKHLVLQFAIFYCHELRFDWYYVLKDTLEFPQQTQKVYSLAEDFATPIAVAFVDSLCHLVFDVCSTDEINYEHSKFLFEKLEFIFEKYLLKFSESGYAEIFAKILDQLVTFAYNQDAFVRNESMERFYKISVLFCQTYHGKQVLEACQLSLIESISKVIESLYEENQIIAYKCLCAMIEHLGIAHLTLSVWKRCIECIGDCHTLSDKLSVSSTSSKLMQHLRVKKCAFSGLQVVISDLLSSIAVEALADLMNAIALFVRANDEMNMSLTAIELLWKFSDFVFGLADYTLWMSTIVLFKEFCSDSRPEIRNSANQSLFRSVTLKTEFIPIELWSRNFNSIFFLLLQDLQEKKFFDSILHATNGCCTLVYSHLDYFIDRFADFASVWQNLLQYLRSSLLIESPLLEYSMCLIKSFRLLLTAANKSSFRNSRYDLWLDIYRFWISINENSLFILPQNVLVNYVQCFGMIFNLIRNSSFYSLEMLDEILQNLHTTIRRPIHKKDYFSDTEQLSSLQSAVMDQIKLIDTAIIPTSEDFIVKNYAVMAKIPWQTHSSCDGVMFASGVALSTFIIGSLLPSLLKLSVLQDATIVFIFDALDFFVKGTLQVKLSQLSIVSFGIIMRSTMNEELPISEPVYDSMCGVCLSIFSQMKSIAGSDFLATHLNFLKAASSFDLYEKLPFVHAEKILKNIELLSRLVCERPEIAFFCIECLFKFSSPSYAVGKRVYSLLLGRSLKCVFKYLEHLQIYGCIPMLDIKYVEILTILKGFEANSYSFEPFYETFKGIVVYEKRQMDVYEKVKEIVLTKTSRTIY